MPSERSGDALGLTKAVIPAAGLGTRLRPATNAIAKVMLPIVDRPVVELVVEEALRSGLDDIVIVVGRDRPVLERHFETSAARITFVDQPEPRGLGHAVACARGHVAGAPFAVLLGDTIVDDPASSVPDLRGLVDTARREGASVVGVQRVPRDRLDRYGIVDPATDPHAPGPWRVRGFVEKPPAGAAPSDLAIAGRYVFTPGIFDCLDCTGAGKAGEVQLTDAMDLLAREEPFFARRLAGRRYDLGDRVGYAACFVEFALRDPEVAAAVPGRQRDEPRV